MRLGLEAGEYTLDLAVEQGVSGVPIEAEKLVESGVKATLKPIHARNLAVCQIGAFGYNPLSTDQAAQAKQQETLEKVIPLAAETGCPYVVIGSGNYHPSGFGAADARNFQVEALDILAAELSPLLALAEKHGVYLSMELYLKTAVNSPERFLTLKEKVGSDALKANIDVSSLYDFGDMIDPSAKIQHVCTALAGHYGLGHIKDIGLEEGFHIHMGLAPLGSSPTDWSEVLRLMAPHMPEDSWLIVEHVLTPEEGRKSLGIVRAAAQKAGITFE